MKWGDQTWNEMMIGYFDVATEIDQQALAEGQAPKLAIDTTSQARQLMKRIDKNADGKISRDEIPDKARLLIIRWDKNRDGEITVDEVAEIIDQQGGESRN